MKAMMMISIYFLIVLFSSHAFAVCSQYSSCGRYQYYDYYDEQTSCSTTSWCPSQNCQCTDPNCYQYNDCLSRSRCCEAFGNIGAR